MYKTTLKKSERRFFRIIILSVFAILVVGVFIDPFFEAREGLRPREGISIGHNEAMHMDGIYFYIINTRDTDTIELRYNVEHIDHSNVGKVGIYFPYIVEMTTDSTGWEKTYVDSGTAFMKKYSCSEEDSCRMNFDEQPIFKLNPEHSKFDTKNRFKHGIKIKVDSAEPPGADKFFRDDNMQNHPLKFWYDNSTKRQVSIVIPRISDNVHLIPPGEPDIFHNRGLDYSNNRIYWDLHKNDHTFFLDYEMPNERSNFETSKLLITMSGIVMGIVLGALGIAITLSNQKQNQIGLNYKIYK